MKIKSNHQNNSSRMLIENIYEHPLKSHTDMRIWILVALISNFLWLSSASIAGVTYMDNFDFEQRYKDINECNPLYWHPLHLPDHCVEMFESAILSRLKSNVPIRLVKHRKDGIIKISSPYAISSSYGTEFPQVPIRPEITYYGQPFGKMLELLSRDVKHHPRAPTVGFLPNVGLVALYQQPISRKSEKMIKKLASIYTPDISYNQSPYFPHTLNSPWTNIKSAKQNDIKSTNKSKKRTRVIKKKINKGSAVAILKRTIYK